MLQVGQRDQLVQVPQSVLVLRQHNQMAAFLAAPAAVAQRDHLLIDLGDLVDTHIPEHLPEGNQHIAHHCRVITGPVVMKVLQTQAGGH